MVLKEPGHSEMEKGGFLHKQEVLLFQGGCLIFQVPQRFHWRHGVQVWVRGHRVHIHVGVGFAL